MRIFIFVSIATDELTVYLSFNLAKIPGEVFHSFVLVQPNRTSMICKLVHNTSDFRHAKRSTVSAEDVKLVARRSTALVSTFHCSVRK